MNSHWSIRNRAIAAVVIPIVILCLLFTPYYLYKRTQQVEKALQSQGEQLIRVIAYMSEFALLANDQKYLSDALNSLIQEPDLVSIEILNSDREVFFRIDKNSTEEDKSVLRFESEIIKKSDDINTFDLEQKIEFYDNSLNSGVGQGKEVQKIGYAILVLSTSQVSKEWYDIIVSSIVLTIVGFLLSVLIGVYFNSNIIKAIEFIKENVAAIRLKDYAALKEMKGSDELTRLNNNIVNDLGLELASANKKMEAQLYEIIEAREDSDKSNAAKTEFLALISHELRTPLFAISGMLQILEDTEINELQEQYINVAVDASGDLLRLIDDITEFSKIEYEQIKIENKFLNFEGLLNNLVFSYQRKVESKNLNLSLNFVGDIKQHSIQILSDSIRLRQILVNLIDNAIKFTSEGEVSINIGTYAITENKCKLCINVEDTGIGIEKDKLNEIFDLFKQVENVTSSREYEGTGLGLTIVKRLTELMGGNIVVKSEMGEGAIFEIEFEVNYKYIDKEIDKKDINRVALDKSWKILLIEDNKRNRDVIIAFMNLVGISVDVAIDGKQGLNMFKNHKYDLIFIDCFMPGMDGFEVAEKIRMIESQSESNFNARIPLVALTASSSESTKDKCYISGIDSIIVKPVTRFDLYKRIAGYLKAKKQIDNIVYVDKESNE